MHAFEVTWYARDRRVCFASQMQSFVIDSPFHGDVPTPLSCYGVIWLYCIIYSMATITFGCDTSGASARIAVVPCLNPNFNLLHIRRKGTWVFRCESNGARIIAARCTVLNDDTVSIKLSSQTLKRDVRLSHLGWANSFIWARPLALFMMYKRDEFSCCKTPYILLKFFFFGARVHVLDRIDRHAVAPTARDRHNYG